MFGWHAAEWSAAGTMASAGVGVAVGIIAIISTKHNKRMADEMEKDRLLRTNPRILLRFERSDQKIYLVAKNFGGAAADVRFAFDPPLVNSKDVNVGLAPPFGAPWPMVFPQQEERVYFDLISDALNGFSAGYFDARYYSRGGEPTPWKVTVHSSDPETGKPFPPKTIPLDLSALAPLPGPAQIRSTELAKGPTWVHGREPTDNERRVEAKAKAFLLGEGVGPVYMDERRDLQAWGALFERFGWTFIADLPYGATAVKSRGPNAGDCIVAAGWNWHVVAITALEAAIKLDQEHFEYEPQSREP